MVHCAEVLAESVVDGSGIRVVAFLQGCPRHCPGCHNEKLLLAEGCKAITEEELATMILGEATSLHQGITFSGGDPLMQADPLNAVIKIIRERKPRLNIWVYTGYLYEEVQNLPVMSLIDVLVDGPFIMEQRDLTLAFRGSANQRIIDVKRTRQLGECIELHLDQNKAV